MPYLTSNKFSFTSKAFPADTFGVVSFTGTEGISQPYEFDITLICNNLSIDLSKAMENQAHFIIHREEGDDVNYYGTLAHFEQLHETDGYAFYRAFLVPRLWWLSITEHLQIILNKSVPDFIADVLKDGGFTPLDFEFRLQKHYEPVEYVCQYGESHLNFISRWLEKEGIYYFFEQTPTGEKVIFTDTAIAHQDLPQGKTLFYAPPSGLDTLHKKEVVKSFTCRHTRMPNKVFLKDYNYRKPSMDVTGSAQVDPKGYGTVYSYNDHFRTPEEGNDLAKIRAESFLCRKECYYGDGSVPYMMPGFTFNLKDHYRTDFNGKYLVIEVSHEGDQTGYLISGIGRELSERESHPYYRNSFTAIPGRVQFRPEAKTPKPKISGSIIAKIDNAESGQYAGLDDQGRYKVSLPFDLSGHADGKGSTWIRMAQPYAGSNHGMHFPLHKGTEILLTFIDGDPDRPVIAAAVPNPDTPSPVVSGNETMSVIQTGGQNRIAIEDRAGNERILLHTPKENTFIRLGSHNNPGGGNGGSVPDHLGPDFSGVAVHTNGAFNLTAGLIDEIILGQNSMSVAGLFERSVLAAAVELYLVISQEVRMGASLELRPWHYQFRRQSVKINGKDTEIIGDGLTVSGKEIKIVGDKTKVSKVVNEVSGNRTEIKGNVETMVVKKLNLKGDVTEIHSEKLNLIGNVKTLNAKNSTVNGKVEQVSGNVTEISENVTKVVTNFESYAGKNLTVTGNIDKVVEMDETIKIGTNGKVINV